MIMSAKPNPRRVLPEIAVFLVVFSLAVLLEQHIDLKMFTYVALIVVAIAAVGMGGFIAYFSRSNWRAHPANRSLMRMAVSVFAVMLLAITSEFIQNYRGQLVLTLTLYIWLAWSSWALLFTLRGQQTRTGVPRRGEQS